MVREGKTVPTTLLPMLLEQICTIDVISLFVKLNPYPPVGGWGVGDPLYLSLITGNPKYLSPMVHDILNFKWTVLQDYWELGVHIENLKQPLSKKMFFGGAAGHRDLSIG